MILPGGYGQGIDWVFYSFCSDTLRRSVRAEWERLDKDKIPLVLMERSDGKSEVFSCWLCCDVVEASDNLASQSRAKDWDGC